MKHEKYNSLIRFNQFILIGLSTLCGILIVIFGLSFFQSDFSEFSKEDFENELMGQAYFASLNQNYQAEIKLYQRVLEKMPEHEAELNFKMGKASFSDGQYLAAIEYYNQTLEIGCSDSIEVFYHVALTAHKLKNYSMAEKYYMLSVNHPQYSKEACFNLGNIYMFQFEDEERALGYYENAIENPSVKTAYKKMILRELKVYPARKDSAINQFLLSELNMEKSESDFDRYDLPEIQRVKPEKTQALIHNYIGIIQANRNNKIAAISHFQKAMAIDPQFADARFNFQKIVSDVKNNFKE